LIVFVPPLAPLDDVPLPQALAISANALASAMAITPRRTLVLRTYVSPSIE
jgi:hypothetical protein